MGHSQVEKAQSRERILAAAAQQIREGGLESVSIGQLMKAANLTHGGFYGHFPSRAALIAAALDRALASGEASFAAASATQAEAARGSVKSIVNRYLSPAHRDDPGGGCAIAALAADVGRAEDQAVRDIMAARLTVSFERMAAAMGGGRAADQAAMAAWSAMVGAVALSRIFAGTPRSDEILRATRRVILDLAAGLAEEEDAGDGAAQA